MPDSGYPLDAYLIIDNNVMVGLTEFFCDQHKQLRFPDMIQATCDGITGVFNSLRRFALDGRVFTTPYVHGEFIPERSSISLRRDYDRRYCENLRTHVKSQVEPLDIQIRKIQTLRQMRQIPKKFGEELSRLSDADLSLVILALGLINARNSRVYILTDEEDLRSFISWMKSKQEVREICPCSDFLDGLHSMIYMDNAHRHCAFTTVQIYEMFVFYQQQQIKRNVLAGTTKLEMIEQTYEEIKQAIRISGQIKIQNMAGAA